MKIVVLDGRTVNKGDLSWEGLKALGECTIHEATSPGEIAERCKEADAVLTNKVPFDGETLMALPNLKYIGCWRPDTISSTRKLPAREVSSSPIFLLTAPGRSCRWYSPTF